MNKHIKNSEIIESFLNLLNDIENKMVSYEKGIKEQDNLTQDYLHSLEIDKLSTSECSKLATKIKTCRKDRRYYKDRKEELQPLYDYYINNKKINNILKNVLGEVRRQERYHENRTYKPRVLKAKSG